MENPGAHYRNIMPGPSPAADGGSTSPPGDDQSKRTSSSGPWKKRASTACLACKKSKRKCSGSAPCENCRTFNRVCIFDESLDQRRRVAAKRTADELNYHRDLLNDLFKVMRSADPSHAQRLLDLVRGDASSEQIREFIDDTLAGMKELPDEGDPETVRKLQDLRHVIHVDGANPSFRRKVMDIHYLCNDAPIKVPAKPWTTVTDDDALVSHLISLYFTWDYPFYAFLDFNIFIKHMSSGNTDSDFCNPFLVNAVLANACHFSEFSEAYAIPGDLMTKGADFLKEADRLSRDFDDDSAKVTLASLQGTLLLYERYALFGNDDYGYVMLHRAVRMGEKLGLVNNGKSLLDHKELSPDMIYSMKRTAWGLFHIDTVVHSSFLRPSLVHKVDVSRIDRNESDENDLWVPYPTHRAPRPAWMSQYFDEACNLCYIARDISRELFVDTKDQPSSTRMKLQRRDDLYEQLRQWEAHLPSVFDPRRKPAAHIILLRMRYHALVINLFSAGHQEEPHTSTASDQGDGVGAAGAAGGAAAAAAAAASATKTSETPEEQREISPLTRANACEIKDHAARSIAALTRLHRAEYGLTRAHTYAMYTINLALFALLEGPDFDILDRDFLSLASAFTIVASRSTLGRNLFHIFRQSVRAKRQGSRIRDSNAIPDELKELFDEESGSKGSTRWDDYAEGLQKLLRSERYRGLGVDVEDGDDALSSKALQEYPGLGLYEMLDRYESLSLGKDEFSSEKQKPDGT